MKEFNNRFLVEQYISLYNAFKIDEMLELFADDCIFQDINNSRGITECKGKQELRNLAYKGAQVFSARQQTALNWVIDENKIAVEIDYVAVVAQDLTLELKKGAEIRLKGVSIYEFKDKKIRRLVDFS